MRCSDQWTISAAPLFSRTMLALSLDAGMLFDAESCAQAFLNKHLQKAEK
jgi:hypothetical protein